MKTAIQINSDSQDPVFKSLCREAAGLMKKAPVPGAALGIFRKGREHYAGLGVTSIDHPLPVTPDALFQIGSISKTFLATIVLMLAEKGKLDLDGERQRGQVFPFALLAGMGGGQDSRPDPFAGAN